MASKKGSAAPGRHRPASHRRLGYKGYGSGAEKGFGGEIHAGRGFAGIGSLEPAGKSVLPRARIFEDEVWERRPDPLEPDVPLLPEPRTSRAIPAAEWPRFFQRFSREHDEAKVSVRILDPRLGSQLVAHDLPLEGAVVEPERGRILLHLGRTFEANLEHEVPRPAAVWVQVAPDGSEPSFEIESLDGSKTIVELR